MLNSYKAGRAVQSAPKELLAQRTAAASGPASRERSRPNPSSTSTTSTRRPSTNRSNSRPAVIREESHDSASSLTSVRPMPHLTTSTFSTGREFGATGVGGDGGGGGAAVMDARQAESLVIREQLKHTGRSEGRTSGRGYVSESMAEATAAEPSGGGRQSHRVERSANNSNSGDGSMVHRLEKQGERRNDRSEKKSQHQDVADKFPHKLRKKFVLIFHLHNFTGSYIYLIY